MIASVKVYQMDYLMNKLLAQKIDSLMVGWFKCREI